MNGLSAMTDPGRRPAGFRCSAAVDQARGMLGYDTPECACDDSAEHSARVAEAVRDLDSEGMLRSAARAIIDRVYRGGTR